MQRTFSAESLASLPPAEQRAIVESLSPTEIDALSFSWPFWARGEQLEPDGDWWTIWLLLAGRGFGKTRTGAEWIISRVARGSRRLVLAGPTSNDIREAMIEGESGILACSPPWNYPDYEPSKLRLTWPNGARATLISADEPERFRNKQADTYWCDELAAWPYPDAWDQLQFGFRLRPTGGLKLRGVVTTTPKPKPLVRQLMKRASKDVAMTRGSTYDNRANLADEFYRDVVSKYEGTRLGRQELEAELLEDVEGALFSRDMFEWPGMRVDKLPANIVRAVVAIDPAAKSKETSDETGIVGAAMDSNKEFYVFADASGRFKPLDWGRRAIKVFDDFDCDRLIGEENNGGEMVESTLRTIRNDLPYEGVWASQGKRARAEPISSLYQRKRVHHVGCFPNLEDEMCTWEPLTGMTSPNRLDAVVWALSSLAFAPVKKRENKSLEAMNLSRY